MIEVHMNGSGQRREKSRGLHRRIRKTAVLLMLALAGPLLKTVLLKSAPGRTRASRSGAAKSFAAWFITTTFCSLTHAQGLNPSAPLTESEMQPCETLLAENLAFDIERAKSDIQGYAPGGPLRRRATLQSTYDSRLEGAKKKLEQLSGISVLDYARSIPPYYPLYDMQNIRTFMKSTREAASMLRAGSEEYMMRAFGEVITGRELQFMIVQRSTFLCMLEVRLAQLEKRPVARSKTGVAGAQPPSASLAGRGTNAASNASGGRDGNIGSQPPLTSCTDEIKRVQIESQSWTGNADDVAARLGRFQKDLFEGRCASHPEAQAYIAGANKMLAYGGNPSGSSGGTTATAPLAPIRRDTQSKEHNPLHNASTCIQVYGPQEIKARGLKTNMNSLLVNTCPYNVSVTWCVEPGNGHAGDCARGYSNTWDLSAAGQEGSRWGIDADGQRVQYAACRHGPNMGFQPVEKDPRFPYRFSCS